MTRLTLVPLGLREANRFVGIEHRHLGPVRGYKFALGATDGDRLVGVAIVARTISRGLHSPHRAEITRLATDGTRGSCSFLYARAKRVVQGMGYTSLKTYTRTDESGASLRAIGACCEAELEARSWAAASKRRPRSDKSEPAARFRWELLPTAIAEPTRPVLRYHGGKWRSAATILDFFPAHRTYVEPFGGGASVLLRKARTYAEVYNDLAGEVVNIFRVLRDPAAAARLREALALTPFARDEFKAVYQSAADPIEAARHAITRSFMGFGSAALNAKHGTGFRSNTKRSRTTPALDWRNYPDQIPAFVERLRGVVIENKDALSLMPTHDHEETLFYVDPPYPECVRAEGAVTGVRQRYIHEMTDDDHRRLCWCLRGLRGMVVLSGRACALYDDELYPDWERHEFKHLDDGARTRIEVVWLNPACSRARAAQRAQGSLFDEASA